MAPERASPRSWHGLGVLILVALFNTVDAQIFGLVAEPIRLALHISDTQIGLLQGVAGILVLSAAAMPVGWLADRLDRRLVLAIGVLTWSVACFWRGFVNDFAGLFAATALLSIGSVGVIPCSYAIIPALFRHRQQRLFANSMYVVVLAFGASAGLALCGSLLYWLDTAHPAFPFGLQSFASWRVAFVLLALPGPVVALLIATIRIPRSDEQLADSTAATEPVAKIGFVDYVKQHPRAVFGVCIGSGVIAIGSAVRLWSPIIAARVFHASPGEVGAGLGAAGAIGIGAGFAVTTIVTRLYAGRLGSRFAPRVLWVGAILSACVSCAIPFTSTATQFFILMGLQATIETAGSIVSPALWQDIGPSYLTSRLIGLGVVLATAISSISPVLVGLISDAMKPAPNGLLIAAVLVGTVGTLLASLIFAFTEKSYNQAADSCRTPLQT